jgi:hypothetical protein
MREFITVDANGGCFGSLLLPECRLSARDVIIQLLLLLLLLILGLLDVP